MASALRSSLLEIERHGVDAVTLTRRSRAVIEDVSEVEPHWRHVTSVRLIP
jgi:hypothetical protein